MILRTNVEWLVNKTPKPTAEEKAQEQAKKEYLGDEYEPPVPVAEVFEEENVDAIIDTYNDKLYVDAGTGKVTMTNLLQSAFIQDETGEVRRFDENITFDATLDDIYDKLIETDKNK